MTVRSAVVGASGYSGAELVGLLAVHPEVSIEAVVAASAAGKRWEELYPGRSHLFTGEIVSFRPEALFGLDVVFLALPHGESGSAAAALHGRVGRVIDLSGDLRLPDEDGYRRWYGREHPAPDLLGKAVYGLPEFFGDELPGADLVSCPGCYAAVSQLAVGPALRLEGTGEAVVISAMSGTSGAGRKADLALSFSEIFGDVRAYRVGQHQHAPEISMGLHRWSRREVRVTFVPHLVPIERGILVTGAVPLREAVTQAEVLDHYRRCYAAAPFVRVLDPAERLPAVRNVARTNVCELAPVVDESGETLVVIGVIDNLVKGAAGQAVQVFNLSAELPETLGLVPGEVVP